MCKRNLIFKAATILCAVAVLCFGIAYAEPLNVSTDVATITSTDKDSQIDALIGSIADSYTDTEDPWAVFDMARGGYKSKLNGTSSLKSTFSDNAALSESLSDLDKYGFALSALGEDISAVTLSDGSTLDLLGNISKYDESGIGYVTNAIMALTLYNSEGYAPDEGLTAGKLIDYILDSRSSSGLWGYTWDGVDYIDYDSTAMVLNAFAPYYAAETAADAGVTDEQYTEIKEVVGKAVDVLSEIQLPNGSLGNANTDAVAIIGLAAVGINPDSDVRFVTESGAGLTDGMLNYALGDNSGFGYMDNNELNSLATEQCFRAMIALRGLSGAASGRYNVYDIAPLGDADSVPTATAKPNSGGSNNSGGSTGGSSVISVTCKVTGDTAHGSEEHAGGYPTWISSVTKSMNSGSTAAQLIKVVLNDAGYTAVGIDSGYISSITAPDGTRLAEGTNGVNSGWLYRVNDVLPNVGISEYKLKSGDKVELYYTDDYTKDDGYKISDNTGNSGGSVNGSGGQTANLPNASASPEPITEATETPLIFADVDENYWGYEYIYAYAKAGIMIGDGDGNFRPDDNITRAEFTAVLARSAGEDVEPTLTKFDDVPEGEWYSGYIAWAAEIGIVNGVGNDCFEPEMSVTREDACAMISRANGNKYENENINDLSFGDSEDISDYAVNAVIFLWSGGIINGYEDGSFRPKAPITRAEACKILALCN